MQYIKRNQFHGEIFNVGCSAFGQVPVPGCFFPPVAFKMIRNMLVQNLKLIRQEGVGYESHSRMGRGMGESDPLPPEGSMWEIVLTEGIKV